MPGPSNKHRNRKKQKTKNIIIKDDYHSRSQLAVQAYINYAILHRPLCLPAFTSTTEEEYNRMTSCERDVQETKGDSTLDRAMIGILSAYNYPVDVKLVGGHSYDVSAYH